MKLTPLRFPLFLLARLTALAPLAHASPPDPIWMGGVLDADDSDEVVVAATCADPATDCVALDAVGTLWPAGSVALARSRPITSLLLFRLSRIALPSSPEVSGVTLPRAVSAAHF